MSENEINKIKNHLKQSIFHWTVLGGFFDELE